MFSRNTVLISIGIFVAVVFSTPSAFAQTIWIVAPGTGGDFSTIQDCINAAVNGDTCQVNPGTYYENVTFLNKEITLRSSSGAQTTIIDGQGDPELPVVRINGGQQEAVLDGFTIRNGDSRQGDPGYPGGIFIYESNPTITDCTIRDCYGYGGGGIGCYYASPEIKGCTLFSNYGGPGGGGGGIRCEDGNPTISGCVIYSNGTDELGGGIMLNRSDAEITNCVLSGNGGWMAIGGGIFCGDSYPTITNCILVDNFAEWAGGIYLADSNPTITNSTIANNDGGFGGGGIYLDGYSYPTITNTILWGNIGRDGPQIYVRSGMPTVTYSDVEGGWTGTGNISTNPLFVGGGDYHIQGSSPCIDTGSNSALALPSKDIDGQGRKLDGDCDDYAVADMGADEYRNNSCNGTFWPSDNAAAASVVGATIETTRISAVFNNLVFLLFPVGAILFLSIRRCRR